MIIHNPLTGLSVAVDNPESFLGLDEVRQFVENKFSIVAEHQLLLVARNSAPLKLELVAEGQVVFLYDRRYFFETYPTIKNFSSTDSTALISLDIEPVPPESPRNRIAWAKKYCESASEISSHLSALSSDLNIIQQGIEVAVRYIEVHITGLERSVSSKKDLAQKLHDDVLLTLEEWHGGYDRLAMFTDYDKITSPSSLNYDDSSTNSQSGSHPILSLQEKFDLASLESKSIECKQAQVALAQEIQRLDTAVSKILASFRRISKKSKDRFPTWHSRGMSDILDDLSAVYDKLCRDVEFMDTPDGEAHRARLNQLHATEFLSMFPSSWKELHENLAKAQEAKRDARGILLEVLSTAAENTGRALRPALVAFGSSLQQAEDLRVAVAQVIDVPYIYGLILVEKASRNKWVEVLREMATSIAEQYADMRAAEVDRRSFTWSKVQLPPALQDYLTMDESDISQMELSIGNVYKYPVTSDMVQEHLNKLRDLGYDEDYADLQAKYHQDHSDATIHQFRLPTLSQHSQKISAYEQKIKGYELRVKKLEDLLHRQHQLGSNNITGAQSGSIMTSNSGSGQPRLIERVHELEEIKRSQDNEITSIKKQLQEMEQKLASQAKSLESTEAIKNDLLANMKTKEDEFVSERISLDKEIDNLKLKVEGMDEELEIGSQEVHRLQGLLEEAMSSINDNSEGDSRLQDKCRDLSQRLFTAYIRSNEVLNTMGLQASKDEEGGYKVNRVKGLRRSTSVIAPAEPEPPGSLYWMSSDQSVEDENYSKFIDHIYIDYDLYRDSVGKRFGDVEHLARKLQKELKNFRSQQSTQAPPSPDEHDRYKVALSHFKVGDLALFLPTKEDAKSPRPWAAFNIGAPHYFLKQTSSQNLDSREYLVARITKIEERVVDKSIDDKTEQNPFDLSDGLRWHYLEVSE